MDELNFWAVLASALLGLTGAPLLLRRAGYPAGKTVFGTLTAAFALLGLCGILSAIQRKSGFDLLPLAWLVPVAAVVGFMVLWRRTAE